MLSSSLNIVSTRSEVEEDIEVMEVEMIPEIGEELGCYHSVSVSWNFIKEYGVDKREEKLVVDPDSDEEDIKDVFLNYGRERHCHMFFEENNGEVDGKKALLHTIRWDVYISEKEALVKGGYLVEVDEKYRKKAIWEVVDDHVVEEGVEHEELYLRGFDFNLFYEEREGCVGDDVQEFSYFLMIINLWPGYWEEKLYRTNKNVDKENGREGTQENG